MTLTGKAKEQFEAWCNSQSPRIITWSARGSSYETVGLYDQPISMQWGVYQDWADSIGYALGIERWSNNSGRFASGIWISDCGENVFWKKRFDTRQEARNAAIEKLNELINKEQ